MAYFQIAIDGPAGSGKSTVARLVAARLGFVYLSTGRFYRAFAYLMREKNLTAEAFLATSDSFSVIVDGDRVSINGKDVSRVLITEEVGRLASAVAANPAIRELAVRMQRRYAESNSVVMDGRDIATVVLPDAQVKVFLTASAAVRARRRAAELNLPASEILALEKEIAARDERDANRAADPLVIAKGATVVDTSDMTIGQVVEKIVSLCGNATGKAA